ncbi:uroporphyrinogen-III C-methyltransferase [Staphylococcus kloosii]|jgi:uroporphyrin-III C-methyltransferase|uniref:Uroporphyrinogen-III C-methyltransferase n=1 Tax=Staphylococcus kloosii TaxID=29384 RepID=A0A921H1K4_9STAP|nr:uroporphyrinogen-III C-methyltransferase [Staphylococcus kloosii]AVQ35124.1 uroporphyrinogen-III C-methyltransferase [Staphylococcus kloosii]MBF7021059.1 uroporphyrinogen-III C-methyltransferase [Staphylococcus kloosii]MBF7025088.1 uroporphyrinogen-III C-methyltransferase [Staphylococcus kloosii]MBF7030334.1 uroporphyrinogen-III C-methyltransferase [Staphylococcus kloosii]MCD8879594.1 uroporphyrinogen-III C-methyltransferase [Staphylococcus kloosii]
MGKVFLVGAGPGDPDLITVKGVKAIEQADVILYDRLVNQSLLDYASSEAKLVYCGKHPNHHSLPQEEINDLLVDLAQNGNTVTRLKGGDPFIFGRGGEEAEQLAAADIQFEIVPGITSGVAAPAYAGIPVTHRDYSSSVAFVTGVIKDSVDADDYWKSLVHGPDTLCIYMGVKKLPDICSLLLKHGKNEDTPVALVHYGTTDNQQTVTGTLTDIVKRAEGIKNPAMIIVGEVVKLRDKISWFESTQLQDNLLEAISY